MKILLVHHSAGAYGAERVLNGLADGLRGRGYDVALELPHDGPAADAARALDLPEIRIAGRHRLPRSPREALGFFATAPAAVARTRHTIREAGPDLIWINSLYNPWAAMAARLSRRPVVWHLHEYPLPEPLGLAAAVLIGVVATRVAAISEFVAEGWSRYPWLRARIDLLPNPLLSGIRPVERPADPSDVASSDGASRGDSEGGSGGESGPFTVGYVGQLEPRKRVNDLVRAVARLADDVRAVIVGDGKDRPGTEAVIRDEGVADRVELTGFVSDINGQLGRFHCLSIPSFREPFGLVALEAMAAGVPVIAARSGALPEVLGDAALFHGPGDPDDLASQIRKLKADHELRREMTALGRHRVAGFDVESWLRRAEAIVRNAAGRRSE